MSDSTLRPSEIDFLASIVEKHCSNCGIRSAEGRESVAASALALFENGVTTEEDMLTRLAREDDPGAARSRGEMH